MSGKTGARDLIGFIGLGAMGRGIATNLLRAGNAVKVWNRSEAPRQALVAQGAQPCTGAAEAAAAPVVFSMLANDAAVRETLLEHGALEAMAAGSVHVNMATISTALARELTALHAERGVAYVAAPVLGRPDVAEAGKLNILAAGEDSAIERVQSLLDVVGQKTWRFGSEPERANAVKLAANLCLASAVGTMAEAAALVRGNDVAPADFLDMLTNTLFAAPAYRTYGELIAKRRYEPAGFKTTLGRKDVQLALDAGAAHGVPMPLAEHLRAELDAAIDNGDGDRDWSVMAEVAARRAGQI